MLLQISISAGAPPLATARLYRAAPSWDCATSSMSLSDHQVPAPDLGNGLELPVGGEGDEGLDLEHGARHGRHLADAAALLQILQRVHGEEGEGVLDQPGHPALCQRLASPCPCRRSSASWSIIMPVPRDPLTES